MDSINYNTEAIKEYLEETDEKGRKINANYSERENDFVRNIKSIASLENEFIDRNRFFDVLKGLDKMLLGECEGKDRRIGRYGYLSDGEVKEILKWIFIERYVFSHAEDDLDEKSMDKTLQEFISDKYDSGVHFFEEILQNIDDAIGRVKKLEDKDDSVTIKWENKEIVFTYPDRGFSFYDLMAITSLGNSIKKGDLKYASIGEKGIGFKSIFSVAEKVDIKSKYFSFGIKYDKTRKTSVLQPDYIELNGQEKNETELRITFFDGFTIDNKSSNDNEKTGFKNQLWQWLFENKKGNYLNYSPFLFLKNIHNVFYKDESTQEIKDESTQEIKIEREEIEDNFSVVKIDNVKYLLYKYSLIFDQELIINRWNEYKNNKNDNEQDSIDRPIEIAFPIVNDNDKEDAKGKKGLFYSFLPTEMDIDNPIYINVDVHLKSSRGRISNNDFQDGSDWNKHVKDNLENALFKAFNTVIENKDNKDVWPVAQNLYLYMWNSQNTEHYFKEELKNFFDTIKNKKVYLNCKTDFVEKNEIWSPNVSTEKEWEDFVSFCLKQPFPVNNNGQEIKQYAYNYAWFDFSKSSDKNGKQWMAELLNIYNGIQDFYKGKPNKNKNKIMIWLIAGAMDANSSDDKNKWKILFVENGSSYSILSKKEIEEQRKVVFFHNNSIEKEQGNNLCVYIYEGVFNSDEQEQKREYKKCLEKLVQEEDWVEFIGKKLKELENQENICVEDLFLKTYMYISKVNIDKIKDIRVSDTIREKTAKKVLPASVWEKVNDQKAGEKVYRERIAEYLRDNQNYKTYQFLSDEFINQLKAEEKNSDNYKKLIIYLEKLGFKTCPEIVNNKYDELTEKIMPDYTNTTFDQDSLQFVFDGKDAEKELKKYLVDFSKEQVFFKISEFNNLKFSKIVFINPAIIKDGFDVTVQTTGPQGGTTNYPNYKYHIESFTRCADEDYNWFNGNKERIDIDHGEVIFANKDYYKWNSIDIKRFQDESKKEESYIDKYGLNNSMIIDYIINSFKGYNTLDKIRWISIWNKVFDVKYKWQDTYNMKIANFLSCYEYISNKNIDSLFVKGYTVDLPDNKKYEESFTDEAREYLCGEFKSDEHIIKKINQSDYCAIIAPEQEVKLDYLSLDSYNNMNNKGEYSHLIFIKDNSKTKKTDYITKILKIFSISLNDAQQKELSDILDEVVENKQKKIDGLEGSCSDFSECIFKDDKQYDKYNEILVNIKKSLPSVWIKDKISAQKKEDWGLKKWLCNEYKIEDFVFQGYGYRCPICGSSSKIHSLTGIKFVRRLKNSDVNSNEQIPYLHLIACLNCADMLDGANKIAIKDYDGKSLVEAIEHFEDVCYCADKYHMYNNSKMKTMKLMFEIDAHEFVEDIKVSFLHMAMFSKLRDEMNNRKRKNKHDK